METVQRRDYSNPTPFMQHYDTAQAVLEKFNLYATQGFGAFEKSLYDDDEWVRRMIPQFRRCEGQDVLVVLGKNLKYSVRTHALLVHG